MTQFEWGHLAGTATSLTLFQYAVSRLVMALGKRAPIDPKAMMVAAHLLSFGLWAVIMQPWAEADFASGWAPLLIALALGLAVDFWRSKRRLGAGA